MAASGNFALWAWLAPALSFVLLSLIVPLRRSGKPAAWLSIVLSAGALVAAVSAWRASVPDMARRMLWEWIPVEDGVLTSVGVLADADSTLMLILVALVSFLVQVYSLGYLADEPPASLGRYYTYQSLFAFSMMGLVLAPNFVQLFICWELVGLCSYLLIGYWYARPEAARAAVKAFWVTKAGDVGFLIGIVMLWSRTGTFDFSELFEMAQGGSDALTGLGLVMFCIYLGAAGKSAQFPFHVWLPDAMEGPTPVSALIHAATMVTAGVYLVARLAPLYHVSATAMGVVAIVGAATALMAATIALVQTDIKKVLAYSTVSQLGYMFLACGVGAFGVAVFHLFTHAFFKALLFLGSGSVIHAMSGEQDMRKMGGLRGKIPVTFWTFLIGTVAIAGIPPFAGYYSKDEILMGAINAGHPVLFGIGMFVALLTAFYMSRLVFMTFFGHFRGGHDAEHHVHESPVSMLGPLAILAAGSALVGIYIKIPEIVDSVFRLEVGHARDLPWVSAFAIVTAITGIILADYFYVMRPDLPARVGAAFAPLRALFEAKYYFDDVYHAFTRKVVVGGSDKVLWKRFDVGLIDGAVNGLAAFWEALAERARYAETGFVRSYVLLILAGAVAVVGYLLWS
jgi:NADH-quinone oxidoreductase subunit L